MQEALRRQEAARRAFVSTASHELRTPLTSLQGTLELLEEDLRDGRLDTNDAQEQLAGAQSQLRRLGRLATELLDLSRLDAAVPMRSEPVELGELCRAVGAEFEIRTRERDCEVVVEPPPGPCWAAGDPGAVARVVRILIDNALRYSPPGRPVRVIPAYHGEQATVEVCDDGPGVGPDDRELIFERFHRGSSGSGGFGLGLAIGRELAARMGGTLELLPDTPGEGARFRLALRIELPSGSHPAGEPAAEIAAAQPQP
jgi:signal transduction histidine kinase